LPIASHRLEFYVRGADGNWSNRISQSGAFAGTTAREIM
jgi:hypothetical protein